MRDLIEKALQQFDLAIADDVRQLAVHAQEAAFARQQRDPDRGLAEGQAEELFASLARESDQDVECVLESLIELQLMIQS
jgi:hypothetical protein